MIEDHSVNVDAWSVVFNIVFVIYIISINLLDLKYKWLPIIFAVVLYIITISINYSNYLNNEFKEKNINDDDVNNSLSDYENKMKLKRTLYIIFTVLLVVSGIVYGIIFLRKKKPNQVQDTIEKDEELQKIIRRNRKPLSQLLSIVKIMSKREKGYDKSIDNFLKYLSFISPQNYKDGIDVKKNIFNLMKKQKIEFTDKNHDEVIEYLRMIDDYWYNVDLTPLLLQTVI